MSTSDGFQGMSNCYVFKSRLQEYAQKVGLSTPVYETIKEGPSHEPTFRSTVIVNDIRYDSLPGFFNRKAAEQSAAEVALMELGRSSDKKECISQPVHETGLCKNLLQEYAQKMNYAIPSYECQKDETPGRVALYTCTVDIGGIKYIGAAARTKKEAEIKAARTALWAIETTGSNETIAANSMHTVVPCKKKATELEVKSQETTAALKPKKSRFKKKQRKKRHARQEGKNVQREKMGISDKIIQNERPTNGFVKDVNNNGLNSYRSDNGAPNLGINSVLSGADLTRLAYEVNKVAGGGQVVNNSTLNPGEIPSGINGMNQTAYGADAAETNARTLEA